MVKLILSSHSESSGVLKNYPTATHSMNTKGSVKTE